jgi:chromobox protein 1
MSVEKEVEKILDKRLMNGKEEFLIKWKNSENNSWKTINELKDCQQMIDEFKGSNQLFNGFDRGFRPFKILGAKLDHKNQLLFLVMFKEDLTTAHLIPNHVLRQKCPQLLIKFYEKNILWIRK